MKRAGCLLLSVCMWGVPLMADPLQNALERQVLVAQEQAQEQVCAESRFAMAVEQFEFNAKYGNRDKDGFIKGVFELAQAYETAVNGHSKLYAIELYGYMDRRLEKHWKWGSRTVASYVLKALKKKAKRAEFSQQRSYNKIRDILLPIHENRQAYFPLVRELTFVRTKLSTMEMDKEVAQGEVRWEKLTHPQLRQVQDAVVQLTDLGKSLAQAEPELLKLITEGLFRDPVTLTGTPMNLGKFLTRYGMYSYSQNDGVTLVKTGNQMLAYTK